MNTETTNSRAVLIDRAEHTDEIRAIASALGVSEVTAALLFHRGCTTPETARRFVRVEDERLYSPFLLAGMKEACAEIENALESGKKIAVYGDYDVDGVTSTALLVQYLEKRGAQVVYYIPDRLAEGYGVSETAVGGLAEKGIGLMITVDTGITANAEVDLAHRLGIRVVVTDHHECQGALPEAEAVVNPHRPDCGYPFKELAGVGVTFKLVCALEQRRAEREGNDEDCLRGVCADYVDLTALGTVADMMSLTGENRLIVALGLGVIGKNARPGLRALLEQAGGGKRLSASTIGFTLAPRVNAAGRVGSAYDAVELFLTRSEFRADEIAAKLCEANKRRQEEENRIDVSTYPLVPEELNKGHDRVLVLAKEGWHRGVTGIVSSRVTERTHLPSFLISFENGIGKGSGRSIPGFDMMEALNRCSDLLVRYGGHEQAAGLTITEEMLEPFRDRINDYAREVIPEEALCPVTKADMELYGEDLTLAQAEELYCLEPCGTGNPVPLFLLRGAEVVEKIPLAQGKHTRLTLRAGDRTVSAVYFGVGPDELDYMPGEKPDVWFQLSVNEFGGSRTVQLLVRDMAQPPAREKTLRETRGRYLALRSGAEAPKKDELPDRGDFALVYTALRRMVTGGKAVLSTSRLCESFGDRMPSVKVRLVLDVLEDTGLLTRTPVEDGGKDGGSAFAERNEYVLNQVKEKVRLEESPLLKELTARACPAYGKEEKEND